MRLPRVAFDVSESDSVLPTDPDTWLGTLVDEAGGGVGVGETVGVGVGVAVGVAAASCTITVPVMNVCASQWNEYVPGVLNRHVPAHPCGSGNSGSGGTPGTTVPAVCVHDVGAAASKSTLCWLVPV